LDVDRRRFLNLAGLGAAGGAATVLAGCGNKQNKGEGPIAGEKPQDPDPEAAAADVSDVNVLNAALDLEHEAVAAYTLALHVLKGANRRAAQQFLEHERAHVKALTQAIKGLGARPNDARGNYHFPRLTSEDAVLRFATQLEKNAISNYVDSIPRLNTAALRAQISSIYANEAEHLAVLNGSLRERSAPTAFVTGEDEG
jgi:rubrerythrin